ncbi:MAG: filamentous hemagglutinin N-terminal domain-containing protein, partial [Leptolyngbyaceae cyanobacterium MAG.088]|nr:filamentous hemagglutinin N-terminal domain-containing protein [Leptolyngbyaceae cyanobacterium MAG.088]
MLSAAFLSVNLAYAASVSGGAMLVSSAPLSPVDISSGYSTFNLNSPDNGVLIAQAVTSAVDDVGTIVTPTTDGQFDITGGQLSGDGGNVFHSFEQFGLSAEQTANFVANPQIQNVLNRVVGGDASYIDGILQVSNSDANLYLINPAGVLFGQNARLNLGGSFTATTADRIGFDDGWLDIFEAGDYAQLVGEPTQFSFSALEPGSVVNLGELAVGENQDLTLLGGNVVNAGSVSAPGGQVTLAAVNGQQTVTLGSADGLLTMELMPLETAQSLSVLSLPELLTGGDFTEGSELVVAADGTVLLQDVIIPEGTGTTAVAGNLDVAGPVGGDINLLGDQVALLGANVDASGGTDGGTARIGGGYQGNDTILNADLTYISEDSTVDVSGGETGDGGLAIVWADGVTQFYGSVDASGGTQVGDGGFVEISGKNQLVFRGDVDTSAVVGQMGTLLLDPIDIIIAAGSGDGDGDGSTDTFQGDTNALLGQILEDDFDGQVITLYESELEGLSGDTNIVLQATNDIIVNDLADDELTFSAGTGTIEFLANSDNDFTDGGDFVIQDATDTIVTNGRNLSISGENLRLGSLLTSGGDITLNGDVILPNDTTLSTGETQSGNITISSSFFSEINSESTPVNLTITSGTGDIDLSSSIGTSAVLASVTLDGAIVETRDITTLNGITIEAQTIPDFGLGDLNTGGGSGDILIETQEDLSVFASDITSGGDIILIVGDDITVDRGSWNAQDNISLISGQTVFLLDYPGDELIIDANGSLTIQGNERIRLEMDNDEDSILRSGGDLILKSDGVIIQNADLKADGNGPFFLKLDDTPNDFTSTSTNTLISSNGNVTFGNYTGLALRIEAQGSINGGSITIVGPNESLSSGVPDADIELLNSLPALILRAGIDPEGASNIPTEIIGETTFNSTVPAESLATIGVGNIDTSVVLGPGGPVILSAPGDITTGNINTSTSELAAEDGFDPAPFTGGFVEIIAVSEVDSSIGGSVTTGSITTVGGNIDIQGTEIQTGSLNASDPLTFDADDINKGAVNLTSTVGDIEVDSIRADAGGVAADAAGRFRATGPTNN